MVEGGFGRERKDLTLISSANIIKQMLKYDKSDLLLGDINDYARIY